MYLHHILVDTINLNYSGTRCYAVTFFVHGPAVMWSYIYDITYWNYEILEVTDSPGYIINKILFKDISFFFYLLEKEKIKYNDIKKIFLSDLKKNDPIKLVNLIGVDTCLHVLINLNKYDNQYYVPKMLEDSVKKSILGNKNKKYFKIL